MIRRFKRNASVAVTADWVVLSSAVVVVSVAIVATVRTSAESAAGKVGDQVGGIGAGAAPNTDCSTSVLESNCNVDKAYCESNGGAFSLNDQGAGMCTGGTKDGWYWDYPNFT